MAVSVAIFGPVHPSAGAQPRVSTGTYLTHPIADVSWVLQGGVFRV